jgi:hypothetical protein
MDVIVIAWNMQKARVYAGGREEVAEALRWTGCVVPDRRRKIW